MDQGFVGLIFSCFIEDRNTKTGRVLYTCFQSIQAQRSSEYERIEIPIHIVPHVTIGKVCLESALELPKILCQEQDAYRRIHSLIHLDSVTKIHNGSVFTKNLCSQMSAVSGPLLQWLEDRLEQNQPTGAATRKGRASARTFFSRIKPETERGRMKISRNKIN